MTAHVVKINQFCSSEVTIYGNQSWNISQLCLFLCPRPIRKYFHYLSLSVYSQQENKPDSLALTTEEVVKTETRLHIILSEARVLPARVKTLCKNLLKKKKSLCTFVGGERTLKKSAPIPTPGLQQSGPLQGISAQDGHCCTTCMWGMLNLCQTSTLNSSKQNQEEKERQGFNIYGYFHRFMLLFLCLGSDKCNLFGVKC